MRARTDDEMRAAGWRHVDDCLPLVDDWRDFGGRSGEVILCHWDFRGISIKYMEVYGNPPDDSRPVWVGGHGHDLGSWPWWRPLDILFRAI